MKGYIYGKNSDTINLKPDKPIDKAGNRVNCGGRKARFHKRLAFHWGLRNRVLPVRLLPGALLLPLTSLPSLWQLLHSPHRRAGLSAISSPARFIWPIPIGRPNA